MRWVLFFLMLSCAKAPVDAQFVTIGVEAYPQTFDPRLATDALSSKISRLVYNGLFRVNDRMEVEPDLVESFQQAPLVLDLEIKKNVRFHNGKVLSVEDVVATYESLKSPGLASPHKSLLDQIERMEILGPYRIQIHLKAPFAPILTNLTLPILPAEIANGVFQPIGTGPYKIASTIDREKISLHRFQGYFGDPPKNEGLIFRTIYEDTLRALEFLKGRLDLVQNAIPNVLLPALCPEFLDSSHPCQPRFSKHPWIGFDQGTGVNFSYLGFNLKDPYLKKIQVRQAIAHAINREELIRYKLKGLAEPATSLLFPGHWAHHPDLPPLEYDPEKAKALLDQVFPDPEGPEPRFRLVYKTSTKKDRVDLALLIAEHLKKVGIEVTVQPYEWGTFFRDIRTGNFQLFSLTWVGVSDPDIFYYAFHSSQGPPNGANRGNYANPEIDRLVVEARQALDRGRRTKLYYQIQEILNRDLPYAPLWYERNWVVTAPSIKGYRLRPDAGFQNLSLISPH